MAEIKKYLDSVALGALVDQIKAEDAKVLAAAKKYTDDAGKLYDTAGSAATAESNAKAYTDQLRDGQVATNKADILKLNGDANTDGSVAKAVADAKALVDADVAAVDAKAVKNAQDIAAINNAESGILAQAKAFATAEDAKVQGNIDTLAETVGELEAYVGEIPSGYTQETVIAYINKKAEETLAAAQGGSSETASSVKAALDTYKSENDARVLAVEGDVSELETAIATEKSRAEGIEAGLETRLKAVEDDHLTSEDRTALEQSIQTNANAIERLTNGVSADEVDGVNDLINYVKEHGTEVTGMQEDIGENATAIAGIAGRMDTAEGKITALESASALHAEKTYVDEQVQALQGVDNTQNQKIAALEAKFGGAEGSVEDMISDAQAAAEATAAADATSKANAAEAAAKSHTDTEVAKDRARLDALELIDHDHANMAELNLIVSGDKAKWDASAAIAHEHGNKSVIDGITAAKVTAWDAAEQNAKTFAQGLNDTMQGVVNGIDARVTKNAEDIALKAAAADLTAAVERIAKNETDIAANTSAINSFTAITAAEVNALFA